MDAQDKDVVSEGLGSVVVYNQWIAPPISGQSPQARYKHAVAVVQDKMYISGGNHNVLDLSDHHVIDLKSWTWSKVDAKVVARSFESSLPVAVAPCAGHSLISEEMTCGLDSPRLLKAIISTRKNMPWENKLLSISSHTKDPSKTIQVKAFDLQTGTWLTFETYGKPLVSRGGQSVTPVGTNLVIFWGQDAKGTLLNDLHMLDPKTMTWDEIDAIGVPPSPRSDHAAAIHVERYLLIFGGGSHATCFNDLHVLDLQSMEWLRPTQGGGIPTPRAGHASVTVGENWFTVGGSDSKSGASETAVLNMSTLMWSVVTSVQGCVPLASEGLSLVVSSFNGKDILVSFGGYNRCYNNEVNVLKPSHKLSLQSNIMEPPMPDNVSAMQNVPNSTKDLESEFEVGLEGKMREIVINNDDPEPTKAKGGETGEGPVAVLKAEKEKLESETQSRDSYEVELKWTMKKALKAKSKRDTSLDWL